MERLSAAGAGATGGGVKPYLPLLIVLIAVAGCELGCSSSKPKNLVGFNPATNRCQSWKDGAFVPPFLPNERCEGLERPVEVPEE